MKKIRKKEEQVVFAYRLGDNSEVERRMIQEGKIKKREDGAYEIFSTETTDEKGEVVKEGDYFKVDGLGNPYPNEKYWFEERHIFLSENCYRQKTEDYLAWEKGEPISEPLQYLLDRSLLQFQPDYPEQYFTAHIWGTTLYGGQDAVLVFYKIERDESGVIREVDFNLVDRREFERTYQYVD